MGLDIHSEVSQPLRLLIDSFVVFIGLHVILLIRPVILIVLGCWRAVPFRSRNHVTVQKNFKSVSEIDFSSSDQVTAFHEVASPSEVELMSLLMIAESHLPPDSKEFLAHPSFSEILLLDFK